MLNSGEISIVSNIGPHLGKASSKKIIFVDTEKKSTCISIDSERSKTVARNERKKSKIK